MNPSILSLEEQDPSPKLVELNSVELRILMDNYSKYLEIYRTSDPDVFNISTRNRQYVGYIVLPDQNVIKISPKIKGASVLLMLAYAFKELEFADDEISFPENKNLHEILIENLKKRLEFLLEQGLHRNYDEIDENLPYVRGRIVLQQQLRQNLILKHRTFCRYAILTHDILENQIIKFTLSHVIRHHPMSQDLKKALIRIYRAFQLVSPIKEFNLAIFRSLQFNRLNQRYHAILRICEILIKNGSIGVDHPGEYESFAFLLDMNRVFEEFFREYLKKNLGLSVAKEYDRHLDEGDRINLEPDIVIRKDRHPVLIIDTKYKIIDDNEIIRTDISQVLDYCLAYGIRNGLLLYPKLGREIHDDHKIINTNIRIKVETLDISSKDNENFEKCLNQFRGTLLDIANKDTNLD